MSDQPRGESLWDNPPWWLFMLALPVIQITNGTNASTKDRCEIWATNFDIVFEHHDAYGPYHSIFEIKLISKNF